MNVVVPRNSFKKGRSMENADKVAQLLSVLKEVAESGKAVSFSTSLGAEDMVITDVIAKNKLPITIFTLDTGRLNEETYQLLQKMMDHYVIDLKVYSPDATALEAYLNELGPNAFYQSVENRKRCCNVRKLVPLKRALAGQDIWITGLRAQQAVTRTDMKVFERDDHFKVQKCNPLLDWSEKEIWSYIKENDVPYNALHDQGFPSIGCAPCTRAITVGEDVRAGRWWWESPESKECGLHAKKS